MGRTSSSHFLFFMASPARMNHIFAPLITKDSILIDFHHSCYSPHFVFLNLTINSCTWSFVHRGFANCIVSTQNFVVSPESVLNSSLRFRLKFNVRTSTPFLPCLLNCLSLVFIMLIGYYEDSEPTEGIVRLLSQGDDVYPSSSSPYIYTSIPLKIAQAPWLWITRRGYFPPIGFNLFPLNGL